MTGRYFGLGRVFQGHPGGIHMKSWSWAMFLVLAAGCAASLQVHSDYDRSHDFSKYRTFAWIADDPLIAPAGERSHVSPLNRRRIVEAVEAELTAKGFQKASDRDAADFVLAYTVGARDKIDVRSYPAPYHGPWYWGAPYFGRYVDARAYTEGVLAIDVFDRETRQPVWHGRAAKRITAEDVEHAAEQIRTAVRMIFADFPPGRTEQGETSAT